MDTATIIISIVVILSAVIPIALFNRMRRNKEKKVLDLLSALAQADGTQLGEYDIDNAYAIATDVKHEKLYFARAEGKKTAVNLADVKHCDMLKRSHETQVDNMNHDVIDVIGLQLNLQGKDTDPYVLEFFNVERDGMMTGSDFHMAEKWARTVNGYITHLHKK